MMIFSKDKKYFLVVFFAFLTSEHGEGGGAMDPGDSGTTKVAIT